MLLGLTLVPIIYAIALVLLIIGCLTTVVVLYYAYKEIKYSKNQQDPLNEDNITFIDNPYNKNN